MRLARMGVSATRSMVFGLARLIWTFRAVVSALDRGGDRAHHIGDETEFDRLPSFVRIIGSSAVRRNPRPML